MAGCLGYVWWLWVFIVLFVVGLWEVWVLLVGEIVDKIVVVPL